MIKRKFTVPTPEKCKALAIKLEGLETRSRLWALGYAKGIADADAEKEILLSVEFPRNAMIFKSNKPHVIESVTNYLLNYGFTVEAM